jgi:hypothetical protein
MVVGKEAMRKVSDKEKLALGLNAVHHAGKKIKRVTLKFFDGRNGKNRA